MQLSRRAATSWRSTTGATCLLLSIRYCLSLMILALMPPNATKVQWSSCAAIANVAWQLQSPLRAYWMRLFFKPPVEGPTVHVKFPEAGSCEECRRGWPAREHLASMLSRPCGCSRPQFCRDLNILSNLRILCWSGSAGRQQAAARRVGCKGAADGGACAERGAAHAAKRRGLARHQRRQPRQEPGRLRLLLGELLDGTYDLHSCADCSQPAAPRLHFCDVRSKTRSPAPVGGQSGVFVNRGQPPGSCSSASNERTLLRRRSELWAPSRLRTTAPPASSGSSRSRTSSTAPGTSLT